MDFFFLTPSVIQSASLLLCTASTNNIAANREELRITYGTAEPCILIVYFIKLNCEGETMTDFILRPYHPSLVLDANAEIPFNHKFLEQT